MKILGLVVVALVAVGCKKGDDCERFFDKVLPALKDDPAMKPDDLDRDKFLAKCRQKPERLTSDPALKCAMDASDADAVKACMKKSLDDYRSKGKQSEAKLMLKRLEKQLKMTFVEKASFPTGQSKTLPDKACCEGQGAKCPVVPAAEWAKDPIWGALEFHIDEPNLFQYSYSSDGQTVHATAVGDLDCDTTMITYVLDGKVEGGNPTFTLTEPPPNAD
jgi:hypothetical protein